MSKIYTLTGEDHQSMLVSEQAIHVSHTSLHNEADFTATLASDPQLERIIAFSSITEVEYNDQDLNDLILTHPPILGDDTTVLGFESEREAEHFRKDLISRLNLSIASQEEESAMSILFSYAIPVVVCLGLFAFFMTVDPSEVEGRRGRKGAAILRLIYGTIGQTGLLVIIGLATAFFGYTLFNRLSNRGTIITYK